MMNAHTSATSGHVVQARNTLLRLPQLNVPRTSLYRRIADQQWTKPVHVGGISCWPLYEVEALNSAYIRGDTPEAIRDLVQRLEAERKTA